MNKQEIELELRRKMSGYGWHWQKLCGLLPSFSRDLSVTPAFIPHIFRERPTMYVIDGYIGLIDRKFEERWIEMGHNEGDTVTNRYCLLLNTSNLVRLLRVSRIHETSWQEDISTYAMHISALLEEMPHDGAALADAFRCDHLVGVELVKFTALGEERKFLAFRRYAQEHYF